MEKYIIILIIIIIFYYLHKLCIQSECDNILNTKNNIDEFTNVDETQEQEQEQEKALVQQEQTLLDIQSKIKENMKAFYALVTQGKDNPEVDKNLITKNSTENFSDMVEIGGVSSVGGGTPKEIEEIIQKFRVLVYTISKLPQTNQTMDAFYKLGKEVISLSETQVVVNDLLALVAKVKIHLPKSLNSISQGLTQQVIYILDRLLTYINELILIYSYTSKNLLTTDVRSGKIEGRSGKYMKDRVKIDVAPRAQTSQQNQMAVAQTKAPEQMVAAQQASTPGKIELKNIIAGNGSLNVKWMPPNDGIKVQKYIVAISQDELNWNSTEVYENRPGLIEFNIPKGLSNGTKYYIRISGVNSNGSGPITSFIVIPQATQQNKMAATQQNKMVATQQNQMAATHQNQMAATQQNQIAPIQQNKMAATQQNKMVATQQNKMAATQQNQMAATQQNQMAATQQNQTAVAQASQQNQMAATQQNQMAVAQASQQNQMAVGQTQTKAQEEVKAVEKAQSNASDYDESERNRYEYFTNIQKKDSYLKDKQTQISICGVGISKNNNMPICMCSN